MLEFSDIQLLLDRIFIPEYFSLKWWPKLNDTSLHFLLSYNHDVD